MLVNNINVWAVSCTFVQKVCVCVHVHFTLISYSNEIFRKIQKMDYTIKPRKKYVSNFPCEIEE